LYFGNFINLLVDIDIWRYWCH